MQQCVSGIYYINIFHIELGHNLVVTIRFLTGMRIQESSRIIASSLTRGMFQFGTLFLSTSPLNTWLELQKLSILFFVCWECSIDPKNAVVPSVNQTWLAGKPPIYFDDVPIKPSLALHLRVFFSIFSLCLSLSLSPSIAISERLARGSYIYIHRIYIYWYCVFIYFICFPLYHLCWHVGKHGNPWNDFHGNRNGSPSMVSSFRNSWSSSWWEVGPEQKSRGHDKNPCKYIILM